MFYLICKGRLSSCLLKNKNQAVETILTVFISPVNQEIYMLKRA